MAMTQVDTGTIHEEKPGAKQSDYTSRLNIFAAVTFILAAIALVLFSFCNMAAKSDPAELTPSTDSLHSF